MTLALRLSSGRPNGRVADVAASEERALDLPVYSVVAASSDPSAVAVHR